MVNRIKELRNEAGMTQKDVGKILNVSDRSVGFYETCGRDPDTETLNVLASFFDVSVDYLLKRTDERRPLMKVSEYFKRYFDNHPNKELAQEVIDQYYESDEDSKRSFRERNNLIDDEVVEDQPLDDDYLDVVKYASSKEVSPEKLRAAIDLISGK